MTPSDHLRTALSTTADHAICTAQLGRSARKCAETLPRPKPSFRAALDDAEARGLALARLAMLLRGKLPDDDREAIEEQWLAAQTRPTRRGSTCSSAWRMSGMRASVMPKPPGALARPMRCALAAVCSSETWCTIRPSTSGSSRG